MAVTLVESGEAAVAVERTGAGPDLVLLHSLLTDSHAFDPLLPWLEQSWRVNRVNLPGFGASTPTAPTIDAQADAIGMLLARGGYDPETTALVGNGWGGFVALGTAIRHGALFDRLLLIGCGTGFPSQAKVAFRRMIELVEIGGMEMVVDVAVRRIYPEGFIATHPEAVAERRAVLLRTRPEAFIAACHALIDVDYSRTAGGVTNQVLVVVGSEDEATPPGLARGLAELVPGADLVEVPGVGHAPQLQAPDRLRAVIAPFLGGQPAPEAPPPLP